MIRFFIALFLVLVLIAAGPLPLCFADESASIPPHVARLKDITEIEGIRDNQLIGYGLVVGLNGTGDKQQTIFSVQTLGNILQRMGVSIQSQITTIQVRNIAAVFVTATLPPFARPGMKVDVTVSSIGDAKSLAGGTLILTPLRAADGNTYAAAQGPLVIGGYSAGTATNAKVVNHPTVGRIPEGALVERDASLDLTQVKLLSILLRDPDFQTAEETASTINHELGASLAHVVDSRRIEITDLKGAGGNLPLLLARIGELTVHTKPPAKVVVNERTGTVVMGGNVTISACSILHGNLSIQVTTDFQVVPPQFLSHDGKTPGSPQVGGTPQGNAPPQSGPPPQAALVPQTTVQVQEAPVQVVHLKEGATVEELIRGLQTMGATARDVIAILQAIKQAGALNADLEVL